MAVQRLPLLRARATGLGQYAPYCAGIYPCPAGLVGQSQSAAQYISYKPVQYCETAIGVTVCPGQPLDAINQYNMQMQADANNKFNQITCNNNWILNGKVGPNNCATIFPVSGQTSVTPPTPPVGSNPTPTRPATKRPLPPPPPPPQVVNPTPVTQTTATGTSVSSPTSAVSLANGSTISPTTTNGSLVSTAGGYVTSAASTTTDPTELIPGVPNWALFAGGAALLLVLLKGGR